MLLLFFAIVTCSIGGLFISKLWRERQTGKESLNWPQTEGLVMRCEYNHSKRNPNARISYLYKVDGKKYHSEQVTVANEFMIYDPRIFADAHPARTKIHVYYKPEHPDVCVIVPGIESQNTACLVLFGVLVLFLTGASLNLVLQTVRCAFAQREHHANA